MLEMMLVTSTNMKANKVGLLEILFLFLYLRVQYIRLSLLSKL